MIIVAGLSVLNKTVLSLPLNCSISDLNKNRRSGDRALLYKNTSTSDIQSSSQSSVPDAVRIKVLTRQGGSLNNNYTSVTPCTFTKTCHLLWKTYH